MVDKEILLKTLKVIESTSENVINLANAIESTLKVVLQLGERIDRLEIDFISKTVSDKIQKCITETK